MVVVMLQKRVTERAVDEYLKKKKDKEKSMLVEGHRQETFALIVLCKTKTPLT